MIKDKLEKAIRERRVISIIYKNEERIVEPHALGFNRKDTLAISAYQIGGYSVSGNLPAWKLYLVENITDISLSNDNFDVRSDFNSNDSHNFNKIILCVKVGSKV